jgi:hypothetical protein
MITRIRGGFLIELPAKQFNPMESGIEILKRLQPGSELFQDPLLSGIKGSQEPEPEPEPAELIPANENLIFVPGGWKDLSVWFLEFENRTDQNSNF